MIVSGIVADGVLSGLLVSGCASATLASFQHGEKPRAAWPLRLPRAGWAAMAWLAIALALPVSISEYGVFAGAAVWLSVLMVVGAGVVGVVGAWPRLAMPFSLGGIVAAAFVCLGLSA